MDSANESEGDVGCGTAAQDRGFRSRCGSNIRRELALFYGPKVPLFNNAGEIAVPGCTGLVALRLMAPTGHRPSDFDRLTSIEFVGKQGGHMVRNLMIGGSEEGSGLMRA